jgi:hypothetical protein
MFLTLTNSNETQPGEPIMINMDMVVTMNRAAVPQTDGALLYKTFIFIPPHGTWEVTESLETISDMLADQAT